MWFRMQNQVLDTSFELNAGEGSSGSGEAVDKGQESLVTSSLVEVGHFQRVRLLRQYEAPIPADAQNLMQGSSPPSIPGNANTT